MSDEKKPESPQPMITISLADFDEQRAKRREAEEALVVSERRYRDAVFANDATNSLAAATNLTRAALKVVRFAVGNLPPEGVRGWPWQALRQISDLLPMLADKNLDDVELAIELRSFARECEAHERRRALNASAQGDTNNSRPG